MNKNKFEENILWYSVLINGDWYEFPENEIIHVISDFISSEETKEITIKRNEKEKK